MSFSYRNRKGQTSKMILFYFIHDSVFRPAKFESDFHPEKLIFSGLSKISHTAAGFPWGRLRWDSLSAPSALHFIPHCLQFAISQSLRPKLRFGTEKLINSARFAAGGNTIELISNWTAEIYFFVYLILKPSIIRKMPVWCFYSSMALQKSTSILIFFV